MLYGVLRMPFDMAMQGEISRIQFYDRAQEAADRLEKAEQEAETLRSQLAAMDALVLRMQRAADAEFSALAEVAEEAAQVFESGAAHNLKQGRTVFAHVQQDRAARIRAAIGRPLKMAPPVG
jgi:hypothetical protein